MSTYETFIGLEIHIQLKTLSKIFCSCRAAFGDEPNNNVCPVCMGYPGVLPSLNGEAMLLSYTVAEALHCNLSPVCVFDRKNYFYPDLPKNYQISQFHHPLGTDGYIEYELEGERRRARIKECHLEEDAGKMIHAGEMSLLDFNRTGTPLLEIVTEPDLRTGAEAEALLHELRRIVRYLAVCDGNMDEGSMRCDANVSVNLTGKGLGSKVEVKNLNSSRFVRKALEFEIDRQCSLMDTNSPIDVETRLWNENRDVTETMRSKEAANDYRYFPEPDLPPFRTDADFLSQVHSKQVELPLERKSRLIKDLGLTEQHVDIITEEKSGVDFFEELLALGVDASAAAAWFVSDVKQHLNSLQQDIADCNLSPAYLSDIIDAIDRKVLSGKLAKQVLAKVFAGEGSPAEIIAREGYRMISDPEELRVIMQTVLEKNPKALADLQSGKAKTAGFIVGQVMRETGGMADPDVLQNLISGLKGSTDHE
ncbi:Asp-tRNA(Asn)/Glu-tRNA(Gln) amidotransferase subunit GatB [Spirochaeta dissipatitropha]